MPFKILAWMENPFKLQLRQRGKEIKSAFSNRGGGF
jgi:hypothetical protein